MTTPIKKLMLAMAAAFALCLGAGADGTHDKVQLWEGGPYWATTNIGADEPWDYGYHFWWGDTVGYTYTGSGWISAKDGTSFLFLSSGPSASTNGKNNSQLQSAGYIDSTGNLVAAYDAATAHWGESWRMPTDAEFSALISNCTTTWITTNGVYGRLVTGKGDYANRSIFFPATGFGSESYNNYRGSQGYYWSSTPKSDNPYNAWYRTVSSGGFKQEYGYNRYVGQTVRPVYVPTAIPVLVKEGLVAYYPFDGDILDASGNGYNLSGSAVTWTSDHKGNENSAASFNGSGYLTPNPIFNEDGSFTLAAWVKPTVAIPTGIPEAGSGTGGYAAANTHSLIIFPPVSADVAGVGVSVGTNAIIVLEHIVNHITASLVWYGDIGADWTHVAVTISDNGAPVLYVNGQYIKTGTKSNFAKKLGSGNNCASTIAGGNGWEGNNYFIGSIDEMMIYSRALAADEIELLAMQWDGEGDGTEASPYVVTSKDDFETVLKLASESFVQFTEGLEIEGPIAVHANVSALTLDLNGGSITGATGEPAILLLGNTGFTATGTGTISADEGIEAVKRQGSITASSGVTITGIGGGGSVPAPAFAEGGASEVVKFAQAEGGKWTITAFAELGNASVGEEVTSGQVKVYAADTVDGLKTASALTEGVAIENKSAVKSTIQVTAPSGKDSQFFKVKFGE